MNKIFNINSASARHFAIEAVQSIALDEGLSVYIQPTNSISRSAAQKRLSHVWFRYIAGETGMTEKEVWALAKWDYGFPILMEHGKPAISNSYTQLYDLLSPLDYEQRMLLLLEIPITTVMNMTQMSMFLESIETEYISKGIPLPKMSDYNIAFGRKTK